MLTGDRKIPFTFSLVSLPASPLASRLAIRRYHRLVAGRFRSRAFPADRQRRFDDRLLMGRLG